MLYKIQLAILLLFSFSTFLWAQENGNFTDMACKFITHNRCVIHCEQQPENLLFLETVDGKNLSILCLWFPQTETGEYRLEEICFSLASKMDYVLIGYGQIPKNPMYCYWLSAKKASKKLKIEKLEKYRLPLPLSDFCF